jgi:hypothetical protein
MGQFSALKTARSRSVAFAHSIRSPEVQRVQKCHRQKLTLSETARFRFGFDLPQINLRLRRSQLPAHDTPSRRDKRRSANQSQNALRAAGHDHCFLCICHFKLLLLTAVSFKFVFISLSPIGFKSMLPRV